MSQWICPYCEVKEAAKFKMHFSAIREYTGKCPDCGAYIDSGQYSIDVNSYPEIYKGAVDLIEGIVQQFNNILDYCDVDIEDFTEDGEPMKITLNRKDIIDALFLGRYGGTTKSNFMKALGISDGYEEFEIKREEYWP